MKKSSFIISLLVSLFFSSNANSQTLVQWYTSMGDFNVQLREDLVPNTAQNFIDLTNSQFYDSLIFHRVIAGFMIQDGCPLGDGTGGPGYTFNDEFHPLLNHNEAGILSMANSGPNTNGSQYFITVAPTTWLNNVHAVFGKVIDGLDVVFEISEVETDANDRPLVDVVIDSIRVITMGTKTLELTSPVLGDIFLANSDLLITWASQFIADVTIEFSMDGGVTWQTIADSISCNAKSFSWHAPDSLATNCKIKISDATNASLFDISETFSLGKLSLTAPYLGTYLGGQELEISWVSEGIPYISLAYQDTINGEWFTIEDSISTTVNSYNWLTPEKASVKYKVKIFVSNTPTAYHVSLGYFKICLLDLLYPIGGEEFVADSVCGIAWSSELISQLTLEFSADNGTTWSEIVPHIYTWDSTYLWTIPDTVSNSCFVKASYKGKPWLNKTNNFPFSIGWSASSEEFTKNDGLRVSISPNPANDVIRIEYSIENKVNKLDISLYDLSGKLVSNILSQSHQPGIYSLEYDARDLKPGVYIVEVKGGGLVATQKIVKE
ncbi:MAG: peptidylprolyl isomerase [Bacteroidales bacterium]|nr:peptidylprolyl isomerase [Bacteroidales bacterium]MCF8454910.1 peptidylprolyl isomerase [Bacteroidales bacterium]